MTTYEENGWFFEAGAWIKNNRGEIVYVVGTEGGLEDPNYSTLEEAKDACRQKYEDSPDDWWVYEFIGDGQGQYDYNDRSWKYDAANDEFVVDDNGD